MVEDDKKNIKIYKTIIINYPSFLLYSIFQNI